MRTSFLGLAAVALSALAVPALAQDAPESDLTVTGGANVVTDYRFRGISQTNKRFAIQGTASISSASTGLYGTVWGSSIDDYVAGGSDAELDFIIGWKKTTAGGTTFDLGVLYYYYPGSSSPNSDFFEPYASVSQTFGPATGKLSVAYAPKQRALGYQDTNLDGVADKEDSLYAAADLSVAVPDTPLSFSAHGGRSFQRSYLTGGVKYWDWSLGASYTYKNFTFGASYVDTNTTLFSYPAGGGSNRNITKAGVVGSVGVAF